MTQIGWTLRVLAECFLNQLAIVVNRAESSKKSASMTLYGEIDNEHMAYRDSRT